MENKTLITLEYDKILKKISEYAVNEETVNKLEETTPVSDFDDVKRLLYETDSAMVLIRKFGSPQIGRVKNIESTVKRLKVGGSLSMGELLNVAAIFRSADSLKKYYADKEGALDECFEELFPERQLEEVISSSIISEEEMADGASSELYSIRRKMKNAGNKIKDALNNIIHSEHYRKFLQDSIITVRNNRYVVPLKAEYKGEISGIVHDMSASGGTLFIEPSTVVNANNELHELSGKEQREIEKILAELSGQVAEKVWELSKNYKNIIEIDAVFSKAKYSNEIKGVCPLMNDEGRLNIKNGRHPLLDPKKVVPQNIMLGDEFDALVVTGPNTGGKTVVLKTVGLFCLMAQSGICVPADDGTVIPVFSEIFADIGDEQSIEQSLSTFSAHMKNIVHILENLTEDSLVLFDELGAGTDPTEGAALATAIIDYVRNMGAKVVATTHYSELKLHALMTDRIENASCEFDVNTLSPTYRLLIGVPGKSNAFAISKRLGIPDYIIEKSKEQLSKESVKFEDVLTGIEKDRQTAEAASREQLRLSGEAQKLKKEIENERRRLESEKDKILNRAREKAAKIIERAQEETEELVEKIKAAEKERDEKETRRVMEEVRRDLGLKLKRTQNRPVNKGKPVKSNVNVNTLKLGASVLLVDLNDKGSVISINKKEETAVIQVGIMKITSKISNLVLLPENDTKELMKFAPKRKESIGAKEVKTEIDLRGMQLEDALIETDRFLDDCIMAGLSSCTVIHGKGTGILRTGIQNMLRKNVRVKSYRSGTYGEGENGVTIIEFK
ncbi:MAG: endonuclease MutS2 [Ruminococcaceae bacterium]|nr:endonuclease MutS2 [Oscillospiraceae bacterium]